MSLNTLVKIYSSQITKGACIMKRLSSGSRVISVCKFMCLKLWTTNKSPCQSNPWYLFDFKYSNVFLRSTETIKSFPRSKSFPSQVKKAEFIRVTRGLAWWHNFSFYRIYKSLFPLEPSCQCGCALSQATGYSPLTCFCPIWEWIKSFDPWVGNPQTTAVRSQCVWHVLNSVLWTEFKAG